MKDKEILELVRREMVQYSMDMTLRDYFAAKAMQDVLREWGIDRANGVATFDEDVWAMARDCYLMADAMLKAREAK